MHVVFDAFAVRSGSSAVILENLLDGWRELEPDDRLTVLVDGDPHFRVADGVHLERVEPPLPGKAGALWLRAVGVRSAARRLGADAVLSAVTASAFLGTGTPRGVVLTDLRHELRPGQFSRGRRLARRISYGWTFLTTDAVFCISERTRDDVVAGHRTARGKALPALLGADHVESWADVGPAVSPYAVAFGHFANKNVDAVLDAWAVFAPDMPEWTLRLVGMGRQDREDAGSRVRELGIENRVELMPWLDDDEFRAVFSGASLVVFPSDFEGFGLPVVEAMRLGIPVVVSSDPALLEVTGGHAEVARDIAAEPLAACMARAVRRTPGQLSEARQFAGTFTWRGMARTVRDRLATRG